MNEDETKICANCSFWLKSSSTEEMGECRRRAPQPVLWQIIQNEDGLRGESETVWPMTLHFNWCGEFQESLRSYKARQEEALEWRRSIQSPEQQAKRDAGMKHLADALTAEADKRYGQKPHELPGQLKAD